MPSKITATYRIVTPMFIGDAEQNATDISPQSVKGALRFWWRALNWGRFLNNAEDEEDALRKLHKREADLFGGLPDEKQKMGGQGAFLLRVQIADKKLDTLNDWPIAQTGSGYLGMGLWETNKQPHREAFLENQTFSVTLYLKPRISDEDKQALQDTLSLWGLIGGLGSRVRRGFGSIALEKLNDEQISFANKEAYWKSLITLLSAYSLPSNNPPFTAFSQAVRLGFSSSSTSARTTHQRLGELFKNYRGQPSALRGARKGVFGLPYTGGTLAQANARRASPLFFHIHPIGKHYDGVVACLPATFHHQDDLANVDESLLNDFFNHLTVMA